MESALRLFKEIDTSNSGAVNTEFFFKIAREVIPFVLEMYTYKESKLKFKTINYKTALEKLFILKHGWDVSRKRNHLCSKDRPIPEDPRSSFSLAEDFDHTRA